MREELIGMEEPRLYNDFIKGLKGKLLAEELNGDRREMWWDVRRNQLGLITNKESDVSDVGEDEAKSVSVILESVILRGWYVHC